MERGSVVAEEGGRNRGIRTGKQDEEGVREGGGGGTNDRRR